MAELNSPFSGWKKDKKIDHDKQDRKFIAILYPDSTEYNFDEVITNICLYAQEWSYCKHDRDVESVMIDGEERERKKKTHYHVCMRFPTPRIRKTVANNIGIEKNYIERAKTWRGVNRYLLHLDDDDKYPYMIHDIESNFDYKELTGCKVTELEKVNELIEYIIENEITSVRKLGDYARKNGLWDAYRRNYMILKDYMYELRAEKDTAAKYAEELKKRMEIYEKEYET